MYRSQIVRLLAIVIAVLLTATVNLDSLESVGESQITLAVHAVSTANKIRVQGVLIGSVTVYLLL